MEAGDELFDPRWLRAAPRLSSPWARLWARLNYPKLHVLERGIRRFAATRDASQPARVHEHGCGPGFNLHVLRQLLDAGGPELEWSGSDISPQAVEFASRPHAGATLEIQVDDAQRSELPDAAYDVMVSADLLGHLPKLDDAIANIRRCLRPGGWYITFTETSGYRDDEGSWRFPIVQAAGVDPWIEKDMHVNLKPAAEVERRFAAQGFTTIARHPNFDGGRTAAALGCKDVTEMVQATGLEPDAYLRRCMWAERVARATRLKPALVFAHRVAKYLRRDRGSADRGGFSFVFERDQSP